MGGYMIDSAESLAVNPEYNPATGTHHVHFDSAECMPSTAVVLAVAAVTETKLLDMAPLNDCVDPEYLDGLFAPKQDGTPRAAGHVTFLFAGYEVTVDSTGEVILTPQQA